MQLKHRRIIIAAAVLIISGISLLVISGQNNTESNDSAEVSDKKDVFREVETYALDVARDGTVTSTGRVETAQSADLSVTSGGALSRITVEIGDRVSAGQILATVDAKDELAALEQARAQVNSAEAQVAGARAQVRTAQSSLNTSRVALENTRAQQDVSVNSSVGAFVTNDLQAYPTQESQGNFTRSADAPIISGNYRSTATGEYRIEVYRSSQRSGFSFRYDGLESGIGAVSTDVAVPLGTRGLFIQWPQNFARSSSIEYVVPVPNNRGQGSVQTQNQLEQSAVGRETAIRSQQSQIEQAETQVGAAETQVEQAIAGVGATRAGLGAANARLENKRLRAPFAGTVTNVSADVGEFVSPGQNFISLVSAGQKIVETSFSARAAGIVRVGDSVLIENRYDGVVSALAPAVTGTAGVQAIVEITDTQSDDLVAGSVVTLVVTTSFNTSDTDQTGSSNQLDVSRTQILVPLSAVVSRGGDYVVYVITDNKAVAIGVSLGKISGDLITVQGIENVQSVIKDAFSIQAGDSVQAKE